MEVDGQVDAGIAGAGEGVAGGGERVGGTGGGDGVGHGGGCFPDVGESGAETEGETGSGVTADTGEHLRGGRDAE